MTKYRVHLTDSERQELAGMVSKGKRKATDMCKANVLLASDEAIERQSEAAISAAVSSFY